MRFNSVCTSLFMASLLSEKSLDDGLQEIKLGQYRDESALRGLRYVLGHALGRIQMSAFRRVGEVIRAWDAPFRDF
jgi:hypothetical protein